MANLPHDLINEILVLLPVKSLLRFRCVCNSWYALINSTDFIYSHLDKSSINRRNRLLTLCWLQKYMPRYCSLTVNDATDINDRFKEFQLNFYQIEGHYGAAVHDCNGLVLLAVMHKHFFILNPSTRHCRELPAIPVQIHNYCDYYLGFGYDATNVDYKVVVLKHSERSDEVWIYGFKSNCWRRIPDSPRTRALHTDDGNSFVDGCVHVLYGGPYIFTILAFDVAKETFSQLPVPFFHHGKGDFLSLQAFEGYLSIAFWNWNPEKVDLYVRKKDGVEFTWTKIFSFSIDFGKGSLFRPPAYGDLRILGYSKEGDKLLFIYSDDKMCSDEMIFAYDLKETSIETIKTKPTGTGYLYKLYKVIYGVESLVSVGSGSLIIHLHKYDRIEKKDFSNSA